MRCPFCGAGDTKVVDSRTTDDRKKRRRHCQQCGKRFNTYEIVERPMLMVTKRDGSVQPFSRQKLTAGILSALKKRPVKPETVNNMIDEIEAVLYQTHVSQVSPDEIGSVVMERLRRVDPVAYVRFASVYMAFSDVEDFIRVIRDMHTT